MVPAVCGLELKGNEFHGCPEDALGFLCDSRAEHADEMGGEVRVAAFSAWVMCCSAALCFGWLIHVLEIRSSREGCRMCSVT